MMKTGTMALSAGSEMIAREGGVWCSCLALLAVLGDFHGRSGARKPLDFSQVLEILGCKQVL